MKKDFTLKAFAITAGLFVCFAVVPEVFPLDSVPTMDVYNLEKIVVHADRFTVSDNRLRLDGMPVTVGLEPDGKEEQFIRRLLDQKEEIVVRVDRGEIFLVSGDNGQF